MKNYVATSSDWTTNANYETDFYTSGWFSWSAWSSWSSSQYFHNFWTGGTWPMLTEGRRVMDGGDDYSGFIANNYPNEVVTDPWYTTWSYTGWWSGSGGERTDFDEVTYGHGTIVSTREFVINGQPLEFRYTYVLEEQSRFVRVTTRVRNIGDSSVNDIYTFTGIQDNWVGEVDSPNNYRGNIENGEFVDLDRARDPSNAILVSTENVGGVFLYSDFEGTTTHLGRCCNTLYAISTDPSTGDISMEHNDASYALGFDLGDLAAGEHISYTWYYGASTENDFTEAFSNVQDYNSQFEDTYSYPSSTTAPTSTSEIATGSSANSLTGQLSELLFSSAPKVATTTAIITMAVVALF